MRARLVKESIENLLVPKSKEDIIKDLSKLSQKEKDLNLFIASRDDKLESVKLLIEAGADVQAQNNVAYENTPLIIASRNGQLDIVKLLIKAGANVNAKNINKEAALMHAAYNNHLEIIKLLIEAGADVNAKNINGYNALTWAYRNNQLDIIELLKSYKTINENLNDILKPKDPEYIKNIQKYFVDVLNSMLKNSQDLMSEINGIINTDINMLNDIQYMFHKSKNIIKDNFEKGISAEKTAKQILKI